MGTPHCDSEEEAERQEEKVGDLDAGPTRDDDDDDDEIRAVRVRDRIRVNVGG